MAAALALPIGLLVKAFGSNRASPLATLAHTLLSERRSVYREAANDENEAWDQ